MREFEKLSVPEPEEGEDPAAYFKRIGIVDVTKKRKGLGVIIGLGRRTRQ